MGENDSDNAVVDIVFGHNELRLEGSEEFISDELSTILEKVDLQSQPQDLAGKAQRANGSGETDILEGSSELGENTGADETEENDSGLEYVAQKLEVEPDSLKRYFFVDGDELHIENPLNIPPRFALLGWCTIQNERKGKVKFDNLGMKDKLVSQEGVEIDVWGDFIYNARRRGDIRDDPDSDQNRNKPFRLTRDGREAFIDWLREEDE